MSALAEIAPRLHRAHQDRLHEISVIDGDDFREGDDFYQTLTVVRHTERHRCGRFMEVREYTDRILVGPNRGVVTRSVYQDCSCGGGTYSFGPVT